METEKVIINQTVIDKLNELVEILFKKDYFYIKENAKEYVDFIYSFMNDLPNKNHRVAVNDNYGKYFCSYKPNKNTTWYIFF